jgi:phosphatidylglycerol:prolipoprotein diacylglycerol transferase
MYPELAGWLDSYAACHWVALALGGAMAAQLLRRDGHPIRPAVVTQGVILLLVGLAGAKLYSLFERTSAESVRWEMAYGYAYAGGIVAIVAVLPWLDRIAPSPVPAQGLGDAVAPAIAVATAVLRVGCFLGGCCFGRPSLLPWAVRFPAPSAAWTWQLNHGLLADDALRSLPVHPLQLYFAAAALATAALLFRWRRRRPASGQLLYLYLAVHEPTKAALEWLRAEPHPAAALVSLALGTMALAALVRDAPALRPAGESRW